MLSQQHVAANFSGDMHSSHQRGNGVHEKRNHTSCKTDEIQWRRGQFEETFLMEDLSRMGREGGEVSADNQPIHYVESQDGLLFKLTIENTVVREFPKDYQHLDHIYYLGNKIDEDDVDPFRLYGMTAIRQELIAAGYNHYEASAPTIADIEHYNLFEKSQLSHWDKEYRDKIIGE